MLPAFDERGGGGGGGGGFPPWSKKKGGGGGVISKIKRGIRSLMEIFPQIIKL